MTVFTRSFSFLWTCLLASIGSAFADTNPPPVLTNPSNCGLNLFITEAGCGPANEFQINVATAPGNSLGGNVYLKELRFVIEHGWAADLDIFLKSPAGVMVEVSTDNGDAFDNYGNPSDTACAQFTTFTSHAVVNACNLPSIVDGDAPFIGTFLPEGNFSDFNDGSSPIGLWTLMICDDGASNLGHLQFVELVFEATDCVAPTEVAVLLEDSTSVLLDWVTGSTCDNILMEYGPVGFTPGTGATAGVGGTVAIGGCPPFLFTGLQPNTQYDIYLRENCGGNHYSNNTCPVQAMTTCSPPPATIIEDFNAQQLCQPFCGATCPIVGTWRNASEDNFDWLVNTDTTLTALTGPPGDNPGGGNYVYLEASGASCRNGKRAVLVSNCIQVVANPDTCDMSFDYNFHGVHINGMSLEVSTDGGESWAVLWTASGNKGPAWNKKFVDLDAYSGMTCQFRFVGRGGNGQFADLALDNILFYGSVDLGFPDFVYYQDGDGDGFGNSAFFIASCQPASFPGYVPNDDDCDDTDFYVNPGAEEILCDDFDSNCNGDTDEYFVEAVGTESQVICNGITGFVVAYPNYDGQIYWYDSLTGGQIIAIGDTLFPSPSSLINNGLDTIVLQFFAEEITQSGCVSNERTAATITIYPSPKLTTTDQPGACFGKTFDLNSVNIQDESGLNGVIRFYDQFPFTPSNETGPIVTPTATTTYYVVAESATGCMDTLNVVYTVQPGPVAHIPDSPTLCRESSKWIMVQDNGNGVGPYQYAWNTGADTSAIEVFSDNTIGTSHSYAVTITDAGGCSSSDTLVVTTIENIQMLLTNSSPVNSCNGSDGSLSVTPLDGTPPFTYEWAGGTIANQPGGLSLTGLQQGSYSFTVTDASPEQCRAVVPTVVVNGPAAIATVESVINVSCHGGNDACINLNVMGGPNTLIEWDNGMQGANICGLTVGVYTAIITEGSCQNVISIPVTEPEALIVNPEVTPVSCHGGSDGQLRLNIFGGTPPIGYHWSNGVFSPTNTNLAAGFYDLTVTDVNGCEIEMEDIEVPEPSPIAISNSVLDQPDCYGSSNGSIAVEAVGGKAPYTYSWSNGGVGSSISNIAAGSYSLQVSDQNGCVFNQDISLSEPQELVVVPDGIQGPTCAGLNNGFIHTEVSGGVGAYAFHWNTGAVTPDLNNIGNGTYRVTVTDDNGCTTQREFPTINSPAVLTASINQTGPYCIGREENCLEVVVTGGLPPFEFDWSTDDEGQMLCFLPYGRYTVTVTDDNGCKAIKTATIDSIQVMTLGFQAFPPLCYGQTGQLAMTVSGGMAPYEVQWSDGQTGLVASNLLAQNHSATVTDANGCVNVLNTIRLTEPEPLVVELSGLDHIACHGGNEGAIDIAVSGGVSPYEFDWTNGAHSEDLNSLTAGIYDVVVTDGNGCTQSILDIAVAAPDPLIPQLDLDLPSSNCQTLQVDELCVAMQGGVAPYQFLWDSGDSSQCLNSPPPGDYHVTITDAAGCTIELMSVKVPEEYNAISLAPLPPNQTTICFGDSTGQVNFIIEGGVGPFQYNWSNGITGLTSSTNLTNDHLPTGNYRVTITDNTGCTAVSPMIAVMSFGKVIPSINTNMVHHVTCKFGTDGFIPVSVSGGQPGYVFHWENASGDSVPGGQTIGNLTAGAYFVTVTDQLGCTGTVSTTIIEPETELLLQPPLIEHVRCFGDSTGSILALPTGGDLPYEFHWQSNGPGNGAITEDLHDLPAGTYHLMVQDANGCIRMANYEVIGTESNITVVVLDSAGVKCFGGNDGFIEIQISGGTPGYYTNWNNISAEEDLYEVPAGPYQLTIFDSVGCHFMTSFTLGTPPLLTASTSVEDQTQINPPNGSASVIASGGTPPYDYKWTNGSMSNTISNMPFGMYGVTVTDANGCETVQWVEIKLNTATDEPTEQVGFELFPNPTSGKAILQAPSHLNKPLELQVFNPLGQLVLLRNSPAQHNTAIPLDLSGQAPGVYHLRISMAGGVVHEGKVVVVR